MNIKSVARRVPFAAAAYRKVAAWRRGRTRKKVLKQLEISPCHQGRQLWETLAACERPVLPQSDQEWKERIEGERERLLGRNDPLKDGSLGEAGLYDDGVSVRDACLVSKQPGPALLLFLLTRALKPLTVIELGTNVGISSAYIGAGLKAAGQNGRITTLDVSPYRQRLAKEIHRNLGIDSVSYSEGLFTDTLRPALADLGSVDLAFIDGHHQYQPTLDYFEEILAFSTPDTVFVFDDIRWSDGMKKAWSRIRSDDRLGLIVDLSSVGICCRRKEDSPRCVYGPLPVF